MDSGSFFTELKRRNVYKVAVAYAVVAWLLLQLASILFPTFEAPAWVMKVFIALVAAGFPIALILAWAFDLTPEGIQRAADAGAARKSPRRGWIALVAIAAVAAAAVGVWQWQSGADEKRAGAASAPLPPPAAEMKSVAVLPFVNMSGDPANEYFSDGITEEILNAIAHLPNLRVAARTSSFAYKGKNEDIAAIAKNLRVTNVVEGSVQRMGDRIRVTAQLIDASSGLHLWSNQFDGDTKDLFAVQDKIAQAIARELKLTFEGRTNSTVRSGTENAASYDAYLKALDATGNKRDVPGALAFIDQAIALDPKFAAAYALKAKLLSNMAFLFTTTSSAAYDQYVAQGDIAAKRAVELDPNLADGYFALGEIARRRGDDATAVENFTRATKLKPADQLAWQGLGLTARDLATSLKHLRHAKELGMTDLYLDRQIASVLDAMGQPEEAHRTMVEVHRSHPEFIPAHVDLGRYEIWLRGRPDRALQFFVEAYRKAPAFVDASVPITAYPALVFMLSGDLEEAERWLARASATGPDSPAVGALQMLLAGARDNGEEISKLASDLPSRPGIAAVHKGFAGDAAILSGNFEAAANIFRALIDSSGAKDDPNKPTMRVRRRQLKLGYSLLKLGKTAEAASLLQGIQIAVAAEPRFSIGGGSSFYETTSGIFYTDAELHAARGEKEKSLEALKSMLTLPDDGLIPIGSLPVAIEDSPLLESVRDTPEFAEFRNEVARRRAVLKRRVEAMRDQLGLATE
ncbi:MAG TPA: tetratricopeptide repeat protein [Chthoniobacterales bacterium]|nr:tetratricopeptide repeat protein [Chthoniobacterales bacterium]